MVACVGVSVVLGFFGRRTGEEGMPLSFARFLFPLFPWVRLVFFYLFLNVCMNTKKQ